MFSKDLDNCSGHNILSLQNKSLLAAFFISPPINPNVILHYILAKIGFVVSLKMNVFFV